MNGLANSIAQGQAQRDAEMDCHGGPVSKVSGPPETTASLARGEPPLQARHQRGLQPPSGTLSPPAAVISDSAFEEQLQSNEMEMPMFSPSKGQRQQPPNSATSVGGASASSAVAAASTETSAAKPATSGTVPSAASIRGAVDARESSTGAVSSDAAAEVATSTGGTAAPVGRRRGRLERPGQQLGPLMTAGRGRSARGVCDLIPEGEYRCGDCHLGRAPFRGVQRPARDWHIRGAARGWHIRGAARVWHIRGAGGDIATRDHHYLGQMGVFLEE